MPWCSSRAGLIVEWFQRRSDKRRKMTGREQLCPVCLQYPLSYIIDLTHHQRNSRKEIWNNGGIKTSLVTVWMLTTGINTNNEGNSTIYLLKDAFLSLLYLWGRKYLALSYHLCQQPRGIPSIQNEYLSI